MEGDVTEDGEGAAVVASTLRHRECVVLPVVIFALFHKKYWVKSQIFQLPSLKHTHTQHKSTHKRRERARTTRWIYNDDERFSRERTQERVCCRCEFNADFKNKKKEGSLEKEEEGKEKKEEEEGRRRRQRGRRRGGEEEEKEKMEEELSLIHI